MYFSFYFKALDRAYLEDIRKGIVPINEVSSFYHEYKESYQRSIRCRKCVKRILSVAFAGCLFLFIYRFLVALGMAKQMSSTVMAISFLVFLIIALATGLLCTIAISFHFGFFRARKTYLLICEKIAEGYPHFFEWTEKLA